MGKHVCRQTCGQVDGLHGEHVGRLLNFQTDWISNRLTSGHIDKRVDMLTDYWIHSKTVGKACRQTYKHVDRRWARTCR